MAGGSKGGGNSNSGDDSSPVIMGGKATMEAPKGLLDAISEIEYMYQLEKDGAMLNAGYFVTKSRLNFWALGFKSTFVSGILMSLLTPLAMGVFEKQIPVFGSTAPTTFDQIFIMFMPISYMFGYGGFLGYTCTRFWGEYSHTMVKNLKGGINLSAVLKAGIIFILFNFIYMVLFTKHRLMAIAAFAAKYISFEHIEKPYLWAIDFQPVFRQSAWFVVLSTFVYLVAINGTYYYAVRRNKNLRKAGALPQ